MDSLVEILRRGVSHPIICILLVVFFAVSLCLGQEMVRVTFEEGQSLRQLANDYLGDPDLWDEILRESSIPSIAAVKVGTSLVIPVGPVKEADEKLQESLSAITQASSTGAKIFAPDLIEKAISLRKEAIEDRKSRKWSECADLAEQSKQAALEALENSEKLRQVSAEAVLSDGKGTVQGRRPSDLVWVETPVGSVLIEEQRVRTLSDSLAEILFIDESRLRLSENSNAVIQRMQRDALTKHEETSVTILAGDVYGILGGTGARKSFTVESSGVKAEVESLNFWAETDGDTTRLANYDTGSIRVVSGGVSTVLGRNQGTLVRALQAPRQARDLLSRTELVEPRDERVVYAERVVLNWVPLENASSYWVEIARDSAFRSLVLSRRGISETRFRTGELDSDVYYWRVAGVDEEGFPGMPSFQRQFEIRKDANAPFLAVESPTAGLVLRKRSVQVAGTADFNSSVQVNGNNVYADDDGHFQTEISLEKGSNEIVVRVVDSAGNSSEKSRKVVFLPDSPMPVAFSSELRNLAPNTFVTSTDYLTLRGRTEPEVRIEVLEQTGSPRFTSYADRDGEFQITVPAPVDSHAYDLRLESPSGYVSTERVVVVRDSKQPTIELDEIPPRVISADAITLVGSTEHAEVLQINGQTVPLNGGKFENSVRLNPGSNEITISAWSSSGVERSLSLSVVRDGEPPEPLRNSVSVETSSGAKRVHVQVWIREFAGAKRVGRFKLFAGQELIDGYLTFDDEDQSYRGSIALNENCSASVKLSAVELEDYSGNRRLYTFN